jgi:proteasome lid subunit RPN8/RPN11
MTGEAAPPEFATWSVSGHAIRIEYSSEVLSEIRATAVEGYHRVRRGGVETGGILFGTHQKNTVRISAWRPVACEYSTGPSFVLSEQEAAKLEESLQAWRNDPELTALEAVGWYRAHNRSEILLSDSDQQFFARFFPEPWQVALIVRPASFAPTRAGFFFREADGSLRTQSSHREFVLPQPQAVARAEEMPIAAEPPVEAGLEMPPASEPPPVVETADPVPVTNRAPLVLPVPHAEPRNASPRWKWYGAAVVVVVAAVTLVLWLLKPASGLSLSATDTSGQLRIAWDRAAGPIRHATGGSLEILDRGSHMEVKLTPADLRSGSVSYARQSGDVVLRLMVYVSGSGPVTEMTHFLRPGEAVPALAPSVAGAPEMKTTVPQRQPETAKARVEPPPAASQPPVAKAPITSYTVTPPAATQIPVRQPPVTLPPALAANASRAVFRAPEGAKPAPSNPIASIAPPTIMGQAGSSQTTPPPSALYTTPRPPALIVAEAPRQAAPASGKIIWTGKLPKDGRLVITGNHASAGALSNALPGRPARVTAYPAALTSAGITLYTPDPRYTKPLTEAPGAENGWNPTTYTFEARRASTVHVLEQPGPQNGYRLVLQSDATKLSMVVLEWHSTQ